jgi:hypothetical protein
MHNRVGRSKKIQYTYSSLIYLVRKEVETVLQNILGAPEQCAVVRAYVIPSHVSIRIVKRF